jgi:hypothetical protein
VKLEIDMRTLERQLLRMRFIGAGETVAGCTTVRTEAAYRRVLHHYDNSSDGLTTSRILIVFEWSTKLSSIMVHPFGYMDEPDYLPASIEHHFRGRATILNVRTLFIERNALLSSHKTVTMSCPLMPR